MYSATDPMRVDGGRTLGRLIFHTSMEATDAFNHLRDRCRDHRPRE